jgi:hypothetical protein
MRLFSIALTVAAVTAAYVPAQAAGLDDAFSNTIISTYPDGRTAELWLNRDGTYKAEGRRHDRSMGHWMVKGDKVCLRQSRPWAPPFAFCTPMIHGGVGSAWSAKAVTGEPIHVRLVAGRSNA